LIDEAGLKIKTIKYPKEKLVKNNMKPGDKVRVVNTEPIDWELDCYVQFAYEDAGLKFPDGIAEIEVIRNR
jgi:hypothetical protein